MNSSQNNTSNYLVPSSGNTHCVTYAGVFSAIPTNIDWRQFSVDNFPFQPQGVFIDNSAGISNLVINIQPINYNVICPKGSIGQYQFPAPDNQTVSITGNGQASINFVDFPVLPTASLFAVGNAIDVNVLTPSPLPVSLPAGAQSVQQLPSPVVSYYASISGAGLNAVIAPAANTNLRKLILSLSDDASLALAGKDLLTVTLNGVIIFKQNIYIPGAAGTLLGAIPIELNFDMVGLNVGAGNLTVALATALATGILDINAYFG